jgi:hypothetical protein
MVDRIPTCGEKSEVEQDDCELESPPLKWSLKKYLVKIGGKTK